MVRSFEFMRSSLLMVGLLLQGAIPPDLWGHIFNGGLACIIFWFYRLDRKDSDERYKALATDYRQIVSENTKALTSLVIHLKGGQP